MKQIIFKISILFFLIISQVLFVSIHSMGNIPPPWIVTNTGTNHTILISEDSNPTINELIIDSGDYIGVFFDSLGFHACGGFTMWDNSTTAIAAWGEDAGNDGFIPGEKFKWKIWDSSKGIEYIAIAAYNGEDFPNFDSYASNGMSGVTSLNAYPEQIINLEQGWNFYTSYISPIYPEWYNIFNEIDSLIIVNKDFEENVNWPPGAKSITEISAAESYKIKVTEEVSFGLWGKQLEPEDTTFIIPPEPHPLSYLRTSTASIELLFEESLSDIQLIKSEDGFLFWPQMNTYELVNFFPGEAYQIIPYDTILFTQPENDTILDISEVTPVLENQFYNTELNTGNNMSLGILNSAWDISLVNGDEIGVFSSSGVLVGSGVYQNDNIGITIWGDDETTEQIDGMIKDMSFNLILRNSETGFEDKIIIKSWLEGDSIYQNNKVNIIDEIEIKQAEEERNYNFEIQYNPFSDLFQIIISVPEQERVEVNLFDYNGRFVKNLIHEELPTGKYYFDINLNGFSSGLYFFKMETRKKSIVKKHNLIKVG